MRIIAFILFVQVMNRQMQDITSPAEIPDSDQTQIKDTMFPPTSEEASTLKLEQW